MRQISAALNGRPLYVLMGIPTNATPEQITQQWRNICRVHHPDVCGGVETDFFRQVRAAYAVLSDPEARGVYDETGLDRNAPENALTMKAMALIQQVVEALLANENLDSDVVRLIRQTLEQTRGMERETLRGLSHKITVAEKAVSRVEKGWKGGDSIKAMALAVLRVKAEESKQAKAETEHKVALISEALRLLEDSEFVSDAPVFQQPIIYQGGGGSGTRLKFGMGW